MHAPTGTARNVCGRNFTTGSVTGAVFALGCGALETTAVRGWISSTVVFIFRRLVCLSRDTEHPDRPDLALPGPVDRTFFWRSKHPFRRVESIRHTAVCPGWGRSDRPELSRL